MVYPHRCPLCEADYRGPIKGRLAIGVACEDRHATLHAEPGGTPDPREPALPGRLLTLGCALCGGEYAWDFFGGRRVGGAVPPTRPPQRAAPARRRSVVVPGSRVRAY